MERIVLNSKSDLLEAFNYFDDKYKDDIIEVIDKYPCVLVGYYCEDWELGDNYIFTAIYKSDFERNKGERF